MSPIPGSGSSLRYRRRCSTSFSSETELLRVFRKLFRVCHAANAECSSRRWYVASATAGDRSSRGASVVEPVDPFESRGLHRPEASPGSVLADPLRLVQLDDEFGQGVIKRITNPPSRRLDSGLRQALGVTDGALSQRWTEAPRGSTARSYGTCSSTSSAKSLSCPIVGEAFMIGSKLLMHTGRYRQQAVELELESNHMRSFG